MAAEIGKDKLLKMYRTMQTIRQFEERLRDLFKEGKVPGFVHVSIGEEASPTGVCAALTDKDYITSTHRGHGHLLAKGGKLKPMMAEIFGKSTGYCKGKGGSMHIADFSIGILGANGIVGAGLPIATGAGLSAKMRKSGQVAVCFFGDGASNEGTFHESLNIASSWKLPVVYVCENNLYGEFTAGKDVTSVKDIADRARGHDMPGIIVNGNDVTEVYETAVQAPLLSFETRFTARGMFTQVELDAIKAEVKREVGEAVAFAQESPLPRPEEALEDVFSAA